MVIDGRVYDVSQFALSHPGGSDIIFRVAGTDATQEFLDIHPPEYAWEYVGPAIGVVSPTASPFNSVLPRADLSVKLVEAESFRLLRAALQTQILTITGGFGAMVQRYMREEVPTPPTRPALSPSTPPAHLPESSRPPHITNPSPAWRQAPLTEADYRSCPELEHHPQDLFG
jgi:predicted heme/steroid binding protein